MTIRKVTCVFGRFDDKSDFVLEPSCPEGHVCEYCKDSFCIEDTDSIIQEIMDWCYKNNTVPLKSMHPELKNSKLSLATLDGGWINVLRLKKFLDGRKSEAKGMILGKRKERTNAKRN
jgi:hypothetical protein